MRHGSMPVEHLRITLKPHNFFKWSPALDVKVVKDACSSLAFGMDTTFTEPPFNYQHAIAESSSCGCRS